MPMPTTKIRVSDFAADLNLPAQEIIDRLKALDEKPKKPTSALTDAESFRSFDSLRSLRMTLFFRGGWILSTAAGCLFIHYI